MKEDLVVIGGGIVGLATAWQASRSGAYSSIRVLEKEDAVARHQTGRNSGVMHSGIYYRPGSLKATLCVQGRRQLVQYCEERGVSHEVCGKVIVAVEPGESQRLQGLLERGRENGVSCEWLDADALSEREPHVRGRAAVQVNDAGIVDYTGVCEALAVDLVREGHTVQTGAKVTGIRHESDGVLILTSAGEVRARQFVNCAGLHADRIARMDGAAPKVRIIPFRGEYYQLTLDARHLCRHLIYPVPDPRFPFLGVHFTRMTDGSIECGPNAVLAFSREGYTFATISPADLLQTLAFPGFRRLAARNWRFGAQEMARSLSKRRYLKALRKLIPEVTAGDLLSAPSGVRAQALYPDGKMADDFVFHPVDRGLHVLNAPSPAATAAFAIAERIVSKLPGRSS